MPSRNRYREERRLTHSPHESRGLRALDLTTQTLLRVTDAYIGRVVIGSEGLVNELKGKMDPQHIIQANGNLVVPYMYRHGLAGHPNRDKIINAGIGRVLSKRPRQITADLQQPRTRQHEVRDSNFVVFVPFLATRGKRDLDLEARMCRDAMRVRQEEIGEPIEALSINVAAILRIADTPSKQEAIAAAEIFGNAGLITVTLDRPQICYTPAKSI